MEVLHGTVYTCALEANFLKMQKSLCQSFRKQITAKYLIEAILFSTSAT